MWFCDKELFNSDGTDGQHWFQKSGPKYTKLHDLSDSLGNWFNATKYIIQKASEEESMGSAFISVSENILSFSRKWGSVKDDIIVSLREGSLMGTYLEDI